MNEQELVGCAMVVFFLLIVFGNPKEVINELKKIKL